MSEKVEQLMNLLWENSIGYTTMQTLASQQTFPKYDIVKDNGAGGWTIDIALAGYSAADIGVTVDEEKRLVVQTINSCLDNSTKPTVEYHHRGIAKRAFKLRWMLNNKIEVTGATFENGILSVFLTEHDHDSAVEIKIKQL